jgi:hypothetical protein
MAFLLSIGCSNIVLERVASNFSLNKIVVHLYLFSSGNGWKKKVDDACSNFKKYFNATGSFERRHPNVLFECRSKVCFHDFQIQRG